MILSLQQEKKYDAYISRAEAFVKRYPKHPLAEQA